MTMIIGWMMMMIILEWMMMIILGWMMHYPTLYPSASQQVTPSSASASSSPQPSYANSSAICWRTLDYLQVGTQAPIYQTCISPHKHYTMF